VRYRKIIPIEDAVALIQDGDVVASSGYGGNGTPEALFAGLEGRFLETGTLRDLTLVWSGGQGDGKDRGLTQTMGKGGSCGLARERRSLSGHQCPEAARCTSYVRCWSIVCGPPRALGGSAGSSPSETPFGAFLAASQAFANGSTG
jgi:hypothetical protein